MIQSLWLYEYTFSEKLKKDKKALAGLKNSLHLRKDILIFQWLSNGFLSLDYFIPENENLIFIHKKNIESDFKIPLTSQWLRKIIMAQYKEHYVEFENKFILFEINVGLFKIIKCFDFNIEVFQDGRFLIHFFETSSLTLGNTDIRQFVRLLTSTEQNQKVPSAFHFTNKKSGKKIPIDDSKTESLSYLLYINAQFPEGYLTFNYKFLNSRFSDYVPSIIQKTRTTLHTTIHHLKSASGLLTAPEGVRLYEQDHLAVNLHPCIPSLNLVIGSNKIVSKLSATYYSGVMVPVTNRYILPVVVYDKQKDSLIFTKIKNLTDNYFNANGKIFWLDVLYLHKDDADIHIITEAKQKYPGMLVIIISLVQTNDEITDKLKQHKILFQRIKYPVDDFMLSNFVVKVLSKLNAKISALKEMFVPKDSYFIGIDLGHNHGVARNTKKSSTIVFTVYNVSGELIWRHVEKDLKLDESLQKDCITFIFEQFKKTITHRKLPDPKKIIFHRDGRLFANDTKNLLYGCKEIFGLDDVEIVEIIKSGYPYVYLHQNNSFINPPAGSYWMSEKNQYAILVTNNQTVVHGEVLHPLIIKRKYGTMPLQHIISQIYWFCKIYTNNIYYPTRLPATTETANNLAGTGKRYDASYKRG